MTEPTFKKAQRLLDQILKLKKTRSEIESDAFSTTIYLIGVPDTVKNKLIKTLNDFIKELEEEFDKL